MPNEQTKEQPKTPPADPYKKVFQSTHLMSGHYDPHTQTMEITFANGAIHVYAPVLATTWKELCSATSPGQYFSANIRSNKSIQSFRKPDKP